MTNEPKAGSGTPYDQVDLAVQRTRLAQERTLLAWVRTSTALIAFGFSIFKFFEFERLQLGVRAPTHLLGTRTFAVVTIAIGLVALVMATLEHQKNMQILRARGQEIRVSFAIFFVGLLFILGLLGLASVLFGQ